MYPAIVASPESTIGAAKTANTPSAARAGTSRRAVHEVAAARAEDDPDDREHDRDGHRELGSGVGEREELADRDQHREADGGQERRRQAPRAGRLDKQAASGAQHRQDEWEDEPGDKHQGRRATLPPPEERVVGQPAGSICPEVARFNARSGSGS